MASGGNCDLELATAHHGGKIKIAILRIVDGVAQNVSALGFVENQPVEFR